MVSAVGGGTWLRMGGGVAATGCFFAAQPVRSTQTKRQTFLIPLFSLSPDRLSMAILVTRPKRGSKRPLTNPCLSFPVNGRLRFLQHLRTCLSFPPLPPPSPP